MARLDVPKIVMKLTTETAITIQSEELVKESPLIIQCTPVGTYPNTEEFLNFPFSGLTDQHLVIDLIYNPEYTAFLKRSADEGAKTVNGFYMLEQQAEKAWEIWNFQKK